MRSTRSTDSLMQQVKKAIAGANARKLSVRQAQQVTNGRGYLLRDPNANADETNFGEWTYREVTSDEGTYINPTASSFEAAVLDSGLDVTTQKVSARGGNIFRRFNASEPYWALFSTKLICDSTREVTLDIDTKHSIWIGFDDVTVLASTPYGPNTQDKCSFVVESGQSANLEIGIYAPSGEVDYFIGGNLANQVSRMMPVDVTAPTAVTGVAVVTTLMDPITNRVQNKVSWANYDTPGNFDVASYNVFKYTATGSSLAGVTDSDYEQIGTVAKASGTNHFIDTNIKYGEWTTYKVQSVDKEGNRSALSTAYDQTQNVDTTGPTTVSSLTVVSQFRSGLGITWTWPTDEDLAGAIIYRDGTTDADKVTIVPYDGNTSFSRIIGGLPQGSNVTLYVRTFDKAGNQGSSTVSVSSNTTGFNELDTTPPAACSDFYVNGGSEAANSSVTLDDNQFIVDLQWLTPSDSDFKQTNIWIYNTTAKNAATAWANAYEYTQVESDPNAYTYFTLPAQDGVTTLWVFFDSEDEAGNVYSDGGTPPYLQFTYSLVAIKNATVVTASPAANENGWHNSDVSFTWEPDADADVSTIAGEYSIDAGSWLADGDRSITVTGETSASGSNYSFRITLTNGIDYTDVGQYLLRLDKTAPTVGSVDGSATFGGVTLTITPGSDSHSGLWKTLVYRNTSNDSGTATLIATIDADNDEYTDATAAAGETYYYWIKHTDKAGNTSSFSSVETVKVVPKQFYGALNIMRNSSFEELNANNTEFIGWERGSESLTVTGDFLSGNAPFHGDRCVIVGTGGQYLEQQGINLFPNSRYGISLYSYCGTTGRFPQVECVFRDAGGAVLSTGTFNCPEASGAWTRVSTRSSDGQKMTIGPSGAESIVDWPANTASMDLRLSATGAGDANIEIDAVMLEEIYYGGAGTGWKNIYTDSLFPNDYVESNSLNLDYISAWIGRFALLNANNIIAGKIESQDGSTYFDLDNDEIVLDHTSYTTSLDDQGLRVVPTGGEATWRTIFHRGPGVLAWGDGIAGGAKSGSYNVISSGNNFRDLDGNATFTYLHPVAVYYSHTEASTGKTFKFPIEQKASSTDFGHGSWNVQVEQTGDEYEVTLNYECVIGATGTYTDRKIITLMQNSYFYNN